MERRRQGSFTRETVVVCYVVSQLSEVTVHNLLKEPRRTGSSHGHGNARSSTDSWTAVERSVSVKVPTEFTELLDSTPKGKWTVMDDGTPFIVYKGTTFMDPKGAFPGWKWR